MKKLFLITAFASSLILTGCFGQSQTQDNSQSQNTGANQVQGSTGNTQEVNSGSTNTGSTCSTGENSSSTCKVDLKGTGDNTVKTGNTQEVISGNAQGTGDDAQTEEIKKDLNKLLEE